MKKLLVICEPRYDISNKSSVNLAMHEILKEYSLYFNEVHCFCPGDENIESIVGKDGIIYHVTKSYGGNRIKKLLYQFNPDVSFLKRVILDNDIEYVQIRIPSFFSLPLYNSIKELPIVKTTYVAGDVSQSISFVFNKIPFIKNIARFLEKQQYNIIKETLVVTTGPVLKEKYSFLNNNIHSFFSTTHNDIKYKNSENLNSSKLRIVFLGRVDPAKRLEDLLEACVILKKEGYQYTLEIIGDGNHLNVIKILAKQLGIYDNIRFNGYISDRSIIDNILLNSDVIVLPSLTEGTPKVLPEAMSRGVIPIAVKNVGSNNFIIQHGVNGFLVGKKSPKTIFKSLKYLIDNPSSRDEIIEEAYKYAKGRTAKNEIKKIWDFVFLNSQNENTANN